jgi:phage-related protein
MRESKIDLIFFETDSGNQPVLEWLRDLPKDDRHAIGQDLLRLQWRWPIGMPLCRSLGKGLWEVRSSLPSDRIARVIFCADGGELVALHGFIKKSQKTPKAELALALERREKLAP